MTDCLLWLLVTVEFNPIALRKAKIVYNFGLSGCSRAKILAVFMVLYYCDDNLRYNFIQLDHGKVMQKYCSNRY